MPFDTLALVGLDDDANYDNAKVQAVRTLFRPDKRGELPLVAFVQSIDTVYKHLRYFRASVSKASVIDQNLELIINGVFYFILTLVLLPINQINPWTFVVSMTSVLVSVSFALGPSVSKYIEVSRKECACTESGAISLFFLCSGCSFDRHTSVSCTRVGTLDALIGGIANEDESCCCINVADHLTSETASTLQAPSRQRKATFP